MCASKTQGLTSLIIGNTIMLTQRKQTGSENQT